MLEEVLSHAENPRLLLTATPKMIDNHLEACFATSTACEWQVPCLSCNQSSLMDERVIGPNSLICSSCQSPLDPQKGNRVARNPHSTWGDGYWINHLMVPWMKMPKLHYRREAYDCVRFRNEVLGLPPDLGDRSDSIGTLFSRIKKGLLRFPRAKECGSFLDEFLCEVAAYDPEKRTITYTKPDTLRDDALHATNYCELIGLRMLPRLVE